MHKHIFYQSRYGLNWQNLDNITLLAEKSSWNKSGRIYFFESDIIFQILYLSISIKEDFLSRLTCIPPICRCDNHRSPAFHRLCYNLFKVGVPVANVVSRGKSRIQVIESWSEILGKNILSWQQISGCFCQDFVVNTPWPLQDIGTFIQLLLQCMYMYVDRDPQSDICSEKIHDSNCLKFWNLNRSISWNRSIYC